MDKKCNGEGVPHRQNKMTERIIIAGSGGQGVMLLGKVIAESAMREDKFVTWLPSYGAEVRGGTAHCMVVISEGSIGSPYVGKADSLIVMNEPSLNKFLRRLKRGGLLLLNSSLSRPPGIKGVRVRALPFTEAALELGNIKVANMVALGAYLSRKGLIQEETALKVIEDMAPENKKALISVNKEAFKKGSSL